MEAIVATYRDGVLTPVKPLDLPEGSQVTVWVQAPHEVRDKLSADDKAFLRQLANDRAAVFRKLAE